MPNVRLEMVSYEVVHCFKNRGLIFFSLCFLYAGRYSTGEADPHFQ